MEYDEKTYFDENEHDDVNGFTILRAQDGKYHIAEKWLATAENNADEDRWMDYWVPEEQLIDRHEDGRCEPKGQLTDEQFEKVCGVVGWYTDEKEAVVA